MNCMYNMERTQRVGHGDGCCTLCPGVTEMNKHIFFKWPGAQHAWATITIFYEAAPQDSTLVDTDLIIDVIDECLIKSPHGMTCFFIVYHTCWLLQTYCNDKMYNTHRPHFSPRVTTDQAKTHLLATTQYNNSHKTCRRLRQATKLISPIRPQQARNHTQWHQKVGKSPEPLRYASLPYTTETTTCTLRHN